LDQIIQEVNRPSFQQFPLSDEMLARLAFNKFTTPTPVQAGAIGPALEGQDVLATAQTGTGKTLSFLIPVCEMLLEEEFGKKPLALIVLPTRELAMQVEKAFRTLRTNNRQQVALVVGGMPERTQLDAIRRGAQLIVATPGRLQDYIERRLVKLDAVKMLVLDEVDRMLDMGFRPAIAQIREQMADDVQTLCYSATLDRAVREVTERYLKNPVRVEIGSVLRPPDSVELRAYDVFQEKKTDLLMQLLNEDKKGSFMVFTRTKRGADKLAKQLGVLGERSEVIHGDRTQGQRNQALRSFSEGRARILVATDVAARGIDVSHVAHVVNYDLPMMAEDFVHRVGRTGRASAKGVASTFFAPFERGDLRQIERRLKIEIKREVVRFNQPQSQKENAA